LLKIIDKFSLEELTKGDIELIFNNLNRLYPCKENTPIELKFSDEKYFLFPFTYLDYDGYFDHDGSTFIASYSIRKTSLLAKDEIYSITKIVKSSNNVTTYNTKINGLDDEIYKILKFIKVY
jgi:hypothetical protein